MYIIFDTETTGKAKNFSAPITDFNNWPRMVQIAWKVYDRDGLEISSENLIIKPDGYTIPQEAINIHRVTNEIANQRGIPLKNALICFKKVVEENKYLVAHNITFDKNVVGCELLRNGMYNYVPDITHIDTMPLTTDFCKILNRNKTGYKWPSLTELHVKLFGVQFEDAHDALVDVDALAKCFFKLQEINVIGFKESVDNRDVDAFMETFDTSTSSCESEFIPMAQLGVHTFHSILEGTGTAEKYADLAKKYNHSHIAITDNSTLSGTFSFFNKCSSKGIKPIFGIEILVNDNIGDFEDKVNEGESSKLKIFAKNSQGYKNLNHLLFLANTDGYYNKSGRIKTEWLLKYSEGLIVTSSGLDGKVADMVLKGREIDAEAYINILRMKFGDDFIAEIQFSKFQKQKIFNNFILKMVNKYKIRPILTNDIYYPEPEDSRIQDVVSAIKSHVPLHFARLKENREMSYFSSKDYLEKNETHNFNYPYSFMKFCMDNTIEVANRCDFEFETGVEKYPKYEPTQDVIDYFKTDVPSEIIVKLAFAKLRQKINLYKENGIVKITEEKITEYVDRLNYEIGVIESKKMLDYFLVNWEIVNFYRKSGYDIGPARGCFQIGSRVKMADGMYAPIETIKHGDEVIDAFGDKQKVVNRLEYDVDEDIIELNFDNGKKITCTLDHEILTNNRGWVTAVNLTEEDDVAEV